MATNVAPDRLRALRETARELIAAGAVPVRLQAKKKKPIGNEWGHLRPAPEDFTERDNIGIKVGASSSLVDIDGDWEESRFLAPKFLPPTGMMHGRPESPRSHYWYRVAGDTEHEMFKDPTVKPGDGKAMIVEYRGGTDNDQRQTMIPPSIHPDTGEVLEWDRRDAAAAVGAADLLRITKALAAASLLARHWPGARHEASLALCGALARAGWPEAKIAAFVTAIASWVNRTQLEIADGEPSKRRAQARDSIAALKANEQVTGMPTLIELGVPEKVIGKVRDWLELPATALNGSIDASGDDDEPDRRGLVSRSGGAVKVAADYVQRFATHDGVVALRRWRGEWYRWFLDRGHYVAVSDERIDASLYRDLHLQRRQDVGDVRHALIAADDVLIDETELSTWIGAASTDHDPLDVAVCQNGLLHLPTRELIPATPRFFATTALGVAFEQQAKAPSLWIAFLEQLWDGDPESIAALQEWFGYLLTTDTRLQKILLLVGPKRSGKGTLMRILTAMLGRASIAAPTLASLGTNFGLQPLIGKTAAIVGDARLGGRSDIAQIVERLLSISGQDPQTIDRKHLQQWTGYLSTRISIVSNELPRFTDAADALTSRMLILELARSWYGQEDVTLTDKLMSELPGILLWAIDGWQRLRERGRFIQPRSSAGAADELSDLASPVKAWVRQRCVELPDARVLCSKAYEKFTEWCEEAGHHKPSSATFGRDLKAATGCQRKQIRDGECLPWFYVGVGLAR